jgi:hypothetical protein
VRHPTTAHQIAPMALPPPHVSCRPLI